MTLEEFENSVREGEQPGSEMDPALKALWWDAKGEWDKAHACCQEGGSKDGDWVHAYLHRKEGDLGNAGYWYSRSGHPRFEGSLEDEWEQIAKALLER